MIAIICILLVVAVYILTASLCQISSAADHAEESDMRKLAINTRHREEPHE